MTRPPKGHRFVRYPIADVEALLGWPPRAVLVDRFGVDVKQLTTWRRFGLTHEDADRVAVAAGFHPMSIWPSWVDRAAVRWTEATVLPSTAERPSIPRARGEALLSA